MGKLVNNGYLIQGLYKNERTSLLEHYEGVEKYVSWPLRDMDDYKSKLLEEEAWDSWFGYKNILEVIPSKAYLIKYKNHCIEKGLNIRILKVETPIYNQLAIDELKVSNVLGFDCIEGIQLSYLNLDNLFFQHQFPSVYEKLNKYGLFDTIEYVYEFLRQYDKLLDEGVNLEYGSSPTPARLSTVELVD